MGQGVSLKHVVGYIVTSLPFQGLQMLPVACLLATLFVVGDLARNREYIAGLAGGVPPERFLGGILLAGFSLSILAFGVNETIVPSATHYSRTVFREKIRRLGEWRQTIFTDLFVTGRNGRIWTVRYFNEASGAMERVIIDTFVNGSIGNQVDATTAVWTDQTGWVFGNGVVRHFKKDGFSIDRIEPFKQRNFNFEEKPSDLITQEPQPEEMGYRQLNKRIKRLMSLGIDVRRLKIELMVKLAFPFSCLVVTCLGVPLALKGKGNKAIGVAAGGGLTLVYLGCMQMGKALALRFIPPFLGAWLGNFVFMGLAFYLWIKMRETA